MSKLVVRKMELGPIGTNAYLLWEDGGKEAVLIDAPPDCTTEIEPVLEEHGLTLSAIWLTHGHWDHMAGASELAGEGVEVLGHSDDKMLFEQPAVMSAFAMPGMEFSPIGITRWIEEGEPLNLWGREVSVFIVPVIAQATPCFGCPAKNFASSAASFFPGALVGRIYRGVILLRSNARLGKKSTICPARLPCCPGMVRIRVLKLNAGAILSFGRSPWGGGKDVLRTLAFR